MRTRYWADGWPALVGLPAGITGLGLLLPRLEPGTRTGWAELLLLLGLGMLALPWLTAMGRVMAWRHQVSGTPRPASLSMTDERLRIERDGTVGEYAWRHVTKTTEAADCHLIWLRPSGTAIALPKRAIPPDLRLEVAEFLRQRGTAALGRATAS
jgi:hypothetical protein